MKVKGQVATTTWLVIGLFLLAISAIVIYVIIHTSVSFKMGLNRGADELQAMAIVNRLLASEECFSNGEMGVLEKEKVDALVGSGSDCAFLPELSYGVVIKNLDTGDKWVFGELDPELVNYANIKKEMNIAILDDSGIHPAYISVIFVTSDVDTSLRLRKAAYRAWVDGESKESLYIRKGGYARFESNKVCYMEYLHETCSEVKDFSFISDEPLPITFSETGSMILQFQKVGGNIKVSKYA